MWYRSVSRSPVLAVVFSFTSLLSLYLATYSGTVESEWVSGVIEKYYIVIVAVLSITMIVSLEMMDIVDDVEHRAVSRGIRISAKLITDYIDGFISVSILSFIDLVLTILYTALGVELIAIASLSLLIACSTLFLLLTTSLWTALKIVSNL